MKKQFIAGMMIVATALSFNAHAAPNAKNGKSFKDNLKERVETLKTYYKKNTTSSNLTAQQKAMVQDKLLNDLNLSAGDKAALKSLLNNAKDKGEIAASLGTILGAKEMAGNNKSNPESASVEQAADAFLKLLVNKDLIGDKQSSSFLNASELALVREALTSLTTKPDSILTSDAQGRDSYTQILSKTDELSTKSETFEEAFVKAVMESQKNITKDKAMELIRKLKDCV